MVQIRCVFNGYIPSWDPATARGPRTSKGSNFGFILEYTLFNKYKEFLSILKGTENFRTQYEINL